MPSDAASVQRHEIYAARLRYGRSNDFRPCLILEVHNNRTVTVAPLSSVVELYNSSIHFWIDASRPEFGATGLRKTSYCDGSLLFTIPQERLTKRFGRLEGDLSREFEKWLA